MPLPDFKIHTTYSRYDIYIGVIGVPLIILFMMIMFGEAQPFTRPFMYDLLFMTIVILVVWYFNKRVIFWLNDKYPWKEDPWKRITTQALINFPVATLIITISTTIFFKLVVDLEINLDTMAPKFITGLLITLIINLAYESAFFFEQWKLSLIESEKFKKESIQSKYQSLRNQVDPHFLFNSFNTLAILMNKDLDASKKFLHELAEVYRYVLNYNDKELVELSSEVEFAKAYIYLLEQRHGDGLHIDLNIDNSSLALFMPPMSLQMVTENAIKHNVVSRSEPLGIHIYIDNDYLVVRNNIQRKLTPSNSTGIGLNNIRNRYKYFTHKDVIVLEDMKQFTVRLPLINVSGK